VTNTGGIIYFHTVLSEFQRKLVLHHVVRDQFGQCFPNFFAHGHLLATKNNHGSSNPCSCKYRILDDKYPKLKFISEN